MHNRGSQSRALTLTLKKIKICDDVYLTISIFSFLRDVQRPTKSSAKKIEAEVWSLSAHLSQKNFFAAAINSKAADAPTLPPPTTNNTRVQQQGGRSVIGGPGAGAGGKFGRRFVTNGGNDDDGGDDDGKKTGRRWPR